VMALCHLGIYDGVEDGREEESRLVKENSHAIGLTELAVLCLRIRSASRMFVYFAMTPIRIRMPVAVGLLSQDVRCIIRTGHCKPLRLRRTRRPRRVPEMSNARPSTYRHQREMIV